MARSIAVTFDYRCPFAYNGNAAVIAAVRAGSDVEFRYTPFSLDQAHTEEGEAPVWERGPDAWGTGTLALLYGLAVRDTFPEHFFDAHLALFAARHDKGLKLGHEDVVRDAVAEAGLDPDAVAEEVASGRPMKTLATEHQEAVDRWEVWGVPTYIEGEEAVFVRFMERGRVDDLERAIDMLQWSRLNEFKRTRISR
ncbi:MAG TPA: DsbA family protein [Acidimicrobiia bacterium]|nr:DsbA family protein [Acidimicrobiia bacterium]